MRSVLKGIAAVVAGFVAATVVMMIVETINGRVFHSELARAAEGLTDREAIRALLSTAPVSAFLVVLLGWILGGVAGGWVAARLSVQASLRHGLIVGGLLTLAGVANNLMIPPPMWFWVVSLVVFLPAAYAGARLAPVR
jgi:site-specific recombinase